MNAWVNPQIYQIYLIKFKIKNKKKNEKKCSYGNDFGTIINSHPGNKYCN